MIERIEKFGERWLGVLILVAVPVFIAMFPVLIGGNDFTMAESQRFQQGFFSTKTQF